MDGDKIKFGLAVAGAVVVSQLVGVLVFRWLEDARANSTTQRARDELEQRQRDLELQQARLNAMKQELATQRNKQVAVEQAEKKPVRIYIDGCFDMMHYGHSNALRQARAAGDVLVVGLVNDEEIVKNKGSAPVMPEHERYEALAACKFVDEVIRSAPYDLTEDWVRTLVDVHKIDFIVHGDDPCITADGKDAYAYAKQIGVYKQIKRTEGVSTTDIVGRMLLMTKEHHLPAPSPTDATDTELGSPARSRGNSSVRSSALQRRPSHGSSEEEGWYGGGVVGGAYGGAVNALALPGISHSKFLPTARRIMQFADGKVPKPTDKVVYIAGGWDLFNAGHIAALKEARKLGDFLLVGVHDDTTVNRMRGHGLPILNLYERALSLLSCRYVDEVIIGAPWVVTEEMITTMNITVVARGTTSDLRNEDGHHHMGWEYVPEEVDRLTDEAFAVPKRLGILRTFASPSPLTALHVIERIMKQREAFQSRYERKSKSEAAYVAQKTYVQEN